MTYRSEIVIVVVKMCCFLQIMETLKWRDPFKVIIFSKQNKTKTKLIDTENKLVIARGEGVSGRGGGRNGCRESKGTNF